MAPVGQAVCPPTGQSSRVLQGDSDLQAPARPVEDYFATIQAPKKELLLVENADHTAVLTMPEVFLKELVARVRPVVNGPEAHVPWAQR